MDTRAQRRAAWNEDLFRETNEAIERGMWRSDPDRLVRFRCECVDMACGAALEATLREYEQVRHSPRRFLIVAGHVTPEVEVVVERTARYLVVEKKELAGVITEDADPRA
ncbi:MAG: hypothetical protein ACRDLT_07565 [Solirubrobacteraceae bacterium]